MYVTTEPPATSQFSDLQLECSHSVRELRVDLKLPGGLVYATIELTAYSFVILLRLVLSARATIRFKFTSQVEQKAMGSVASFLVF